MNKERYKFSPNDSKLEYDFFSEGPKGRIRKAVSFKVEIVNGLTYYNLCFGDWDEERKRINDLSRTNNLDTNKLLLTVVDIVLEFTSHFPKAFIFVKGSTPARTRLYQMAIAANWKEIDPLFYVYGNSNEDWELFMINIKYEAFLIVRK